MTNRLEPQAEYYPADDTPKLVAAVVDVETTGTKPDSDKIIELHVVADHAGAFGDGRDDRDDRVVFEWLPRSKARKVRFASDSPLEEAGFEPLVPGDGELSWALSHSMSGGV